MSTQTLYLCSYYSRGNGGGGVADVFLVLPRAGGYVLFHTDLCGNSAAVNGKGSDSGNVLAR
jgi:hypothetical protein